MLRKLVEKLFWFLYNRDTEKFLPFTPEQVDEILSRYREDDDLRELLKSILAGDKERYWRANNEIARQRIRGEYARTLYLYRKIFLEGKRSVPRGEERVNTKIAGRYE